VVLLRLLLVVLLVPLLVPLLILMLMLLRLPGGLRSRASREVVSN